MARGKKQNTLYVMEAKLHKGEINVAQRDVSIELWHKRIRHISANLQGMPLKTCDHCSVGKAHRVVYRTYPQSRKSNVIDLIHIDV